MAVMHIKRMKLWLKMFPTTRHNFFSPLRSLLFLLFPFFFWVAVMEIFSILLLDKMYGCVALVQLKIMNLSRFFCCLRCQTKNKTVLKNKEKKKKTEIIAILLQKFHIMLKVMLPMMPLRMSVFVNACSVV